MDASTEPTFDPSAEAVGTPSAPGAPPVDAGVPDVSDSSETVLDKAKSMGADAVQGIVHGAESAVRGVRTAARGVADATGLSTMVGDQAANEKPLSFGSDAPQGLTGQITASLTEAALSWVAGGRLLKAAGATVDGATILGSGVQTAAGSLITTDASHERLSNVLMDYPVIGPAFALLASNPEDGFVMAKAKAALEEGFTSAAATGIFNALHLAVLKAKGASPEAITKAEKLVVDDVGRANKDLTLDQSLPSNVMTSKSQVAEYKQVKMSDLAVRESDHMNSTGKNPLEPEKVKAFQDRLAKNDMQKMPPVDVTTDPVTGEMRLLDGRHRVAAAQGEGFETITAKVLRDKNAKELMAELPGATPLEAPVKPTIVRGPAGEALVTLSEAQSRKFQSLQAKLVIKDAISPTPDLPAGPMAKEGTVNAKYVNAPNEVLQTLKDLGRLTKSQLPNAGERTWSETNTLAEMLGQHPDQLLANLKAANQGLEDIDAIATGARQYLASQGAELFALARKATVSGDPASKEAHKALYTQMAGFQAEFSDLTSKLGRGLRSYGQEVGPFDMKATLAKLADPAEAAKLERLVAATNGDPNLIAHILKMQQLSWFQKAVGTHNEYWTGLALLSRVATQVVNVGSTAINSLMEPAAMVVGGIERGLTGKGWAEAREGVAIYSGMRTAIFDSMHMAWQAAKTESAILSQAGTMEQKTKFISALTYNTNPDSFGGKVIDLFGELTRLSFRGLTAGDEFFKQLSYRAKISATASREAVDMVKAGTLARTDIASYVAKQLQASIDDQGRALVPDALKYAEKATFVGDLKGSTWGDYASMGEITARAASANPILRGVILPFVKTPTNVTRTTFEYTPLIGQLRKQFYTDVAQGGEKQALALGKLTLGAGFYTGAAMLALEGRVTGAPPAPGIIVPKGWKPYSVVFKGMADGGGDLYLSYQRLQPFGDVLGLTADFAKSSGMLDVDTRDGLAHSMVLAMGKLLDGDSETISKAATSAAAAYGKSLISKTYYRNMTEFFSTFSGYNNEAAMVRWFQNYTASHVPGMLSQFNSDDTVREVRSTMDAIYSRIPGLSQTLPANRDYFGNINDTKMGWPYSIIQPLAMSGTKVDPVMSELQRLSQSNAQAKFPEMEHTMVIGGQKVDLKTIRDNNGTSAYDRMKELMQTVKAPGQSQNFHDRLETVMSGARYQRGVESPLLDGSPMTPGVRLNLVKAEELSYRQAALNKMKDEFRGPLGIESALKDKINFDVGRKKIGAGVYDKILDLNK